MENIVIIGSGGLAKEIAFLIEEVNKFEKKWEILGFIDKKDDEFTGKYKIYNDDEWLRTINYPINVAFGIGNPVIIHQLAQKFVQNKKLKFPNLVHQNVVANWERISIGQGNIVCAGNVFTTDIKIGSFNIFNLSCTLGHDTEIGNYNVFNPSVNISGSIKLTNQILVGTGTQILQNLTINSELVIGAGAVVNKDLLEKGVYVGVPAKRIK